MVIVRPALSGLLGRKKLAVSLSSEDCSQLSGTSKLMPLSAQVTFFSVSEDVAEAAGLASVDSVGVGAGLSSLGFLILGNWAAAPRVTTRANVTATQKVS